MGNTLLIGCSFTDPVWQKDIPWSIEYSQTYPSYIVAKAGYGIYGICTEGLYWLKILTGINKVIAILPTLWRMDIEVDNETYLSDAMTDLIYSNDGNWVISKTASRKWIISGGLNFNKNTTQGKIFDTMYKHKGYLLLLKEHLRALQQLSNYCKINGIELHVSAIQDPMKQFNGLDYIRDQAETLLVEVEYAKWFKFDGMFIDEFLGHSNYPTTEEHKILCKHIIKETHYGKSI